MGISSNNPNKDAILDLNNTDGTNVKGLLLPKVTLTATDLALPFSAHIAGMHVYNTSNIGSGATRVSYGEYYNDGSKWIKLQSNSWELTTNGAINSTGNFIGTTDAAALNITTNNTTRIYLPENGKIILGGSKSTLAGSKNATVMINKPLQIKDGTQGNGNIFRSDANGVGSWSVNNNATIGVGLYKCATAQTFNNATSTQLQTVKQIILLTKGTYKVTVRWNGKCDGRNVSTESTSAIFELYKNGVKVDEQEQYKTLLPVNDKFFLISELIAIGCQPNDELTIKIRPNIGVTGCKWYSGTNGTNATLMPSVVVMKL